MEKTSRKSTSDLLTWTEAPPSPSLHSDPRRSHQPSDGISKVVFGGQVSEEEAMGLQAKKCCSGYKLKEMSGSNLFGEDENNEASETKKGTRPYQQALNGISQIWFGEEESVSPKKPVSIPEVAKQRELSGTILKDSDSEAKRQISHAKFKEISGHDIFAPTTEDAPHMARSLESKAALEPAPAATRNIRTSVKVSNPAGGQSNIVFGDESSVKTVKKIHDQKFQELTGNDIFKSNEPPAAGEKSLSLAKLKEMSGNDIFGDGKAQSRDYFGGVRKPPGGSSSLKLE